MEGGLGVRGVFEAPGESDWDGSNINHRFSIIDCQLLFPHNEGWTPDWTRTSTCPILELVGRGVCTSRMSLHWCIKKSTTPTSFSEPLGIPHHPTALPQHFTGPVPRPPRPSLAVVLCPSCAQLILHGTQVHARHPEQCGWTSPFRRWTPRLQPAAPGAAWSRLEPLGRNGRHHPVHLPAVVKWSGIVGGWTKKMRRKSCSP